MGNTSLSYEDMRTISSNLKTDSNEMKTIFEAVKRQFELVGDKGTWSGDSATKTRQTLDQLSSQFNSFYQSVEDCGRVLDTVVAAYAAADASSNSRVNM